MSSNRGCGLRLQAVLVFLLAASLSGAAGATGRVPPRVLPAGGEAAHRQQAHAYRNDRLLVQLRPGVSAASAEALLRAAGAADVVAFRRPRALASAPIDLWRVVRTGPVVDLARLRAALLRLPQVTRVEYDYQRRATVEPNDPYFGSLWGLQNVGQSGGVADADVDAPQAWDLVTGDPGLVVAVIDTGVRDNHEDLQANVWTNAGEIPGNGVDDDANGYVDDAHGYNFFNGTPNADDDFGHGTHCAGTIAAVGNNGVGVIGVAWQARIMSVKFLGSEGYGYTEGAIASVLYATDMGARVLSNSWGGGPYSQALRDAIATADQAGALFVAAAGNASNDNDASPTYPATYDVPNVVAVAASDATDSLAYFSSYGATTVDLAAPGVDILSTVPQYGTYLSDPSGYMTLNGTSMATPHVSGAAVLAFARFPGITHHQVKARLIGGVDPVPALSGLTLSGGRLNAYNSLDDDSTPPGAIVDLAAQESTALSAALSWTAPGDDGDDGVASLYDLRYSTAPIDAGNFAAATPAPAPAPAPAGTPQSAIVEGLDPGTTYYFALRAVDNAGNAGAISNAATATTRDLQLVFADDFESGGGDWTVEGADGAGGPALWHLSGHRWASPTTAFYYGREDTLNYDTGATNFGAITSAPITLAQQDSVLEFQHFLDNENLAPFDTGVVLVSADGGASWTEVWSRWFSTTGMVRERVDLSAYNGQTIRLRFSFATLDPILNQFEGWVVDDVRVLGLVEDDEVPPAPVGDLAVAEHGASYAQLTWTASADDGAAGTAASAYDVRFATFPLDEASFDAATPASGEPVPGWPGAAESFRLAGLAPDTTYHVALRVIDNVGNASPVSNVATLTTLPATFGSVFYENFEYEAWNWTIEGTDGVGGPALWSFDWSFDGMSPAKALRYARYNGPAGVTYDTGARNHGTITSPLIDLAGIESARLTFMNWLETENQPPYDTARVQVSEDGETWNDVLATAYGTDYQVVRREVDLSAYEGRLIRLRFAFDTLTAADNGYGGWRIDDVAVTGIGGGLTNRPVVAIIGSHPPKRYKGMWAHFSGGPSYDPEGMPLTYTWDFGDGATQSGPDADAHHVYTASGVYTVSLTVSDGVNESTDTTTMQIDNRVPSAKHNGPYSGKKQQPIAFSSAGTIDYDGDPLSYAWQFGDGASSTEPFPTHAYASAGTYTVTLSVSDGEGVTTVATTATITNSKPVAVLAGPYSVERHEPVTFDATASSDADGDALIFDWDFGDGTTRNDAGPAPQHAYAAVGTFTAKVTVRDGDVGGTAQATTTVTVAPAELDPDPFAFADAADAPRGMMITSEAVTLSGLDAARPISVVDGAYSVDGGDFTTTAGMVANGQSVRVRHSSSAAFASRVTSTLTVGGVSATFTSITVAQDTTPDGFAFASRTEVPWGATIISDAVIVAGINDAAPISVTGGQYSIDGGAFTGAEGTISAGQSVRLRHTSSTQSATSVSTTLAIGGVSGTFTSTTMAKDTKADAFAFQDQTGLPRSTTVTSNEVTITGINAPASIAITGGQYSIDGGAFTYTAGTITNGQRVRVRHTTSSSFQSSVTSMLNVGGTMGTFRTTTVARDTLPDAFTFATQSGVARSAPVTSAEVAITGINDATPIAVADGEYSINGGAFTATAGTVANNQRVRVRHTASSAFATSVTSTLTVGGASAAFTSVTESEDTTPDAFTFRDHPGVLPLAEVYSDTIIVLGINAPAPISVGGAGSYQVNEGGAFVTTPGTVQPGDRVTLRVTAAVVPQSTVETTLTIGGVSDTWTVRTMP